MVSMETKKWKIFEQVLDNEAKSGKFPWIQDGKSLIRHVVKTYSDTFLPSKWFLFLKGIIYLYLFSLIYFAFQTALNQPSHEIFFTHQKNCIVQPAMLDCKSWSNPLDMEDATYTETNYKTWTMYASLLSCLLLLSYFPYVISMKMKQIRTGCISMWYGIWQMIRTLLFIVVFIPHITWWIWGWIGSVCMIIYTSVLRIPYELFGTFTIPWIL